MKRFGMCMKRFGISLRDIIKDSDLGNCEEELPKKPVGRLLVACRPTGFARNIGYLSADSW